MTYERLTLGNGYRVKEKEVCGLSDKNGDGIHFHETYNRLAELEDKIESGRAVILPCKVGDHVWRVSNETLKEYVVIWFDVCYLDAENTIWGFEFRCDPVLAYKVPFWFDENGIGETIFTTKEAAEAKLKELRG